MYDLVDPQIFATSSSCARAFVIRFFPAFFCAWLFLVGRGPLEVSEGRVDTHVATKLV